MYLLVLVAGCFGLMGGLEQGSLSLIEFCLYSLVFALVMFIWGQAKGYFNEL